MLQQLSQAAVNGYSRRSNLNKMLSKKVKFSKVLSRNYARRLSTLKATRQGKLAS